MIDAEHVNSKIILALDYADSDAALALVKKLNHRECRLKVGLELYTAAGNGFVRDLVERGFDVFLDLKFHDIPNTVAHACNVAAGLGVWMINVHALGGAAMMAAARQAIDDCPHQPLLIGVTILTSHDTEALSQLGIAGDTSVAVLRLARLAREAGLDGVVCSPQEASLLREELGEKFKLITPGIRLPGDSSDDQQRVMTPDQAIAQGSDYLVIGRPVTQAGDPVAVLDKLNKLILIQ